MDIDMEDVNGDNQYYQLVGPYQQTPGYPHMATSAVEMAVPPNTLGTLFIVVDTNVLLSNLDVVVDLTRLAAMANIIIIIPSAVVLELDKLKSTPEKSVEARRANDWLYHTLAANSPHVRGQKRLEVVRNHTHNDEAILDCCLYLKQHHPHDLIILMSNDKNLCAKALSDNVLTVTVLKDLTAEIIAEAIVKERQLMAQGGPAPSRDIEMAESTSRPLFDLIPPTDDTPTLVFREIEHVATQLVDQAIVKCYGGREFIADYHAPATLYEAAQMLIRFWFTVFEEYITTCDPFRVDNQTKKKLIKREPKMVDVPRATALLEFVDFWRSLLVPIYNEVMGDDRDLTLNNYFSRWTKMAEGQ